MFTCFGAEEDGDFRDGFSGFVADERFFNRGQVLQRSQNDPSPFLSADVFRKVAQLLREDEEYLIFVVQLILDGQSMKRVARLDIPGGMG